MGGLAMNVFLNIPAYKGKWALKESREFTAEERKMIYSAKVVDSDYGLSVCFTMVNGTHQFIGLSTSSTAGLGDTVDVSKAKLLTLSREGDKDIYKVEI